LRELVMRKIVWWLILIAGVALLIAIFYNAIQRMRLKPQPSPPVAAPPAPKLPAEAEIRFPLPQESQEKPLPALSESDPAMTEALGSLWADHAFEQILHLQEFIRRVVATIDNLPRQKLPLRLMPAKPTAGKFLVTIKDNAPVISPENAARYAPYVRLAEAVDSKKLVALYVHFYPLFQQAYRDLGYPNAYFNDRLVEVIDHLLATPEVQAPVRLVRPKVFYRFADSGLEVRSAGQKILMRIGNENAARIKVKLREIRVELTREKPEP